MIRVLYIEDDETLVDLVKIICEEESFQIDSVPSVAAAKFHLQENAPDLLLLDLNLHDSKGMDTIKEFVDCSIPMMVLTSDPTEEFAEQAASLGVADYLLKTGISRANLPARLLFIHSREQMARKPKKRARFTGLESMKPYLSCAVLA